MMGRVNTVTCDDAEVLRAEAKALEKAGRWEDAQIKWDEAKAAERIAIYVEQPKRGKRWWQR